VKAYSFRLAGVARIRRLEEGIAAQELAVAAHAVALARQDVARATRRLGELAAPTGTASVQDVRWTQDQADRLSESRRAHLASLEAAETRRAAARDRWLVSRRRCAVLERLDDRRRGEWQTEFDRSEAKELDDMASVGGPGAPDAAGGARW
jgi:flagellar export protein FliJ